MSDFTSVVATADGDIQRVPAQKLSLRQRMLTPALEQQDAAASFAAAAAASRKSPSPDSGLNARHTTPTHSPQAQAQAQAPSGAADAADVTTAAAAPDTSAEGELRARLAKISSAGRTWAEQSNKSLQAIDAELRSIDSAVAGLGSEIKEAARLEADVKRLRKSGDIGEEAACDVLRAVEATRAEMLDAKRKAEPRTAGTFAEFFMGTFNVKMYRDGERYVFKNKYEQFKQRMAYPFIVFIALSFLLPESRVVKSLFNSWCLLYYISLVCREQVLRANGSRIKGWWIVHHYISALASIVVLFWPMASTTYQQTQQAVKIYSILQVIVQEIQTQYQLGRLYKMVAMGKANPMDVTNEVSPHRWAPNIDFLYPFVTLVQLFQLYLAYKFFITGYNQRSGEWQVYTMALLFLVLGVGNIAATNEAYIFRWRSYHPHRGSKPGLEPGDGVDGTEISARPASPASPTAIAPATTTAAAQRASE